MRRSHVGTFKSERARAHFLTVYQTAMAQFPPVSESTDVPTTFGTVRALDIPVLALIAGRSVMLDAALATARARRLLPHGQIELWADASHAVNGEYPAEIAKRAGAFWADVDAVGDGVSSQ